MNEKDTYLIRLDDGDRVSYGECALFKGLSAEDRDDYEAELANACLNPAKAINHCYSSIRFGFEQALAKYESTPWSRGEVGIPINGLIWMGDKTAMAQRIREKLDAGFKVLKLKIGGIDFNDELDLIARVRKIFSPSDLEIRLDANGSFSPENALDRLLQLAEYKIHSIEQPIKAGQWEEMAALCRESPVAIALDEELIGFRSRSEMKAMLEITKPKYIILKPSLCGGFKSADAYIDIADELGICWWATSALESNVGLLGIASWLASKSINMPQGLGTGQLYNNNFASPLCLRGSSLWYNPAGSQINLEHLPWRQTL